MLQMARSLIPQQQRKGTLQGPLKLVQAAEQNLPNDLRLLLYPW